MLVLNEGAANFCSFEANLNPIEFLSKNGKNLHLS